MSREHFAGLLVCPETHADRHPRWARGSDDRSLIIITINRTAQWKLICNKCGKVSGAIPNRLIHDLGMTPAGEVQINNPDCRALRWDPCSYIGCNTEITELHHFAPRNTFGADAENWPVMPLCRAHHVEWHTRMDGYEWRKKAAA